ncbi:hypothetical protein [Actinomadura fulvescens]
MLINGQSALNRKELAERAGVSYPTVGYWFANADRLGFPAQHRRGRSTYVVEEEFMQWLEEWRQRDDWRRKREEPKDLSGSPNELIGPQGVADIFGVHVATINGYVRKSIPAWERGEKGLLPPPDEVEVTGKVIHRRWRRKTITDFKRPGVGRKKGTPQPFPSEAKKKLEITKAILRVAAQDPGRSETPEGLATVLQVSARVAATYLHEVAPDVIKEYQLRPFSDIVAAMTGSTEETRLWQAKQAMRRDDAPQPVFKYNRVRYYRPDELETFLAHLETGGN